MSPSNLARLHLYLNMPGVHFLGTPGMCTILVHTSNKLYYDGLGIGFRDDTVAPDEQ
jgi:hypothetical protein